MPEKKQKGKSIQAQKDPGIVEKNFSLKVVWIISFLFFIISMIGILHHEMWRDEFQSWLVARDSHSLFELYHNCIYEGHPMLWYVFLFCLSAFTSSPFVMQILNVLLGTFFIYLFVRHSGFSLIQCILFSFGYYTIFEYTMISRSYNLELVLSALFCVLYKYPEKKLLLLFLTLFLLANTSAFGLVFAIGFGALFYIDFFFKMRKNIFSNINSKKMLIGSVIFITGIIFSVIQIKPEQGNLVNTNIASLLDFERLETVISRIYNAFFLLPDISLLPHWNMSGTMRLESQNVSLYFLFSCLIGICIILSLYRKPLVLSFYLAVAIGIIIICELPFIIAARYLGHAFTAFIFALWLSAYFPSYPFKNALNRFLSSTGKKIQPFFIFIVLSVQLVAGAVYYFNDIRLPFSGSEEAANFIKREGLDSLPLVGAQDYAVSPFAALLKTQVFYPESKSYGSFIIWDNNMRKNQNLDFGVVIESIDSVLGNTHAKALVILNTLPSGPTGKLEHDLVTPTIKLDIIHQSENTMVADEYYYIYLATRVR